MEAIFGESRYVDRLPIGLPELLKTVPAQRVRDFYEDFYRPDRMAVIAVGDFDPAEMETLIRTHFGGLRSRPPAAREVYPVPPHQDTRVVVVSDREAQGSSVSIIRKRPGGGTSFGWRLPAILTPEAHPEHGERAVLGNRAPP